MVGITRRNFLKALGVGAATPVLAKLPKLPQAQDTTPDTPTVSGGTADIVVSPRDVVTLYEAHDRIVPGQVISIYSNGTVGPAHGNCPTVLGVALTRAEKGGHVKVLTKGAFTIDGLAF